MTPRERVQRCLTFQHPDRLPRQLGVLPWAVFYHPEELARIQARFPDDIIGAPNIYRPSPRVHGDAYEVGSYTDDWGCVFTNLQRGVHGEVKDPILRDLADWKSIQPPYETLPENLEATRERIRRFCGETDRFVHGSCNPRPWERYQFLRGAESALMDVADPSPEFLSLLRTIHEYYLRELEIWAATDVDGLAFMDDWGGQRQLLISPDTWRAVFKPLYRDYCDLIHAAGKYAFMHSDGHIQAIYPDLVEVGVDALNSQLFCMDMAELARIAKGKLTFWGEIDRQHVLPSKDPDVGRQAVRKVARHLYDPSGGVIVQFEFTAGSNPAVVTAILEEWERIDAEHGRG